MKKDYWSEVTKDGEGLYQMGSQSHRVYLLNLLAELEVNGFLDVGCGTAPLFELIINTPLEYPVSIHVRKWDPYYKGVDPSESMIKACKKHFPGGNFDVADATNLSLETDSSWDAVVLMHSLDYVYNVEKALQESARVTKKYVVIILWQPLNYTAGATHHLNNSVDGDTEHDWSTAHLQQFSWEQLQKDFTGAGLKLIEKKDDGEINKEGKHNTLILLQKI